MADLAPEFIGARSHALRMRYDAVELSKAAQECYRSAIESVAECIAMRQPIFHGKLPSLERFLPYSIPPNDYRALLNRMLDNTIALAGADMGNVQLFHSDLGVLKIEVQCGFDHRFLEYFDSVNSGKAACGAALESAHAVMVEDVTQSPIFTDSLALEILLDARVRAVRSVPLLTNSGAVLGVVSTHYRKPHSLDRKTMQSIDFLAQRITDVIEICGARNSKSRGTRLRGNHRA